MFKLKSKTAKVLYAIIASIIIHFIWRNSSIVIDFLDISRTSVLGQSIRALLLTLAVFVFTAFVIKPKEVFTFLGLNSNALKGFGIAFVCVLPLYVMFSISGKLANDVSIFRIYHKCIIAGFSEVHIRKSCNYNELQDFSLSFTRLWWSWRELNPRPNVELMSFLHA